MTITKTSRTARTISRARQIWAELDDVQRRLLEIRTGIPVVSRENRRGFKQDPSQD